MIAYTGSNPEIRRQSEIYTIRIDGSHRRQLTTTGGHSPVWSPDGTRLAFVRGTAIWLWNAADGAQQRVVEGDSPAWSPDGQRLSYTCNQSRDLCFLDVSTGTGGVVVEATARWFFVGDSTWSPDGTWIAVTRYTDGDDRRSFAVLVADQGAGIPSRGLPDLPGSVGTPNPVRGSPHGPSLNAIFMASLSGSEPMELLDHFQQNEYTARGSEGGTK